MLARRDLQANCLLIVPPGIDYLIIEKMVILKFCYQIVKAEEAMSRIYGRASITCIISKSESEEDYNKACLIYGTIWYTFAYITGYI